MSTKQIIIVRKDLKMSKGKMAAQVAHASMGAVFNLMKSDAETFHYEQKANDGASDWIFGSFAKIVLYCDDYEHMKTIEQKAKDKGLNTCVIVDEGRTVFKEPTPTCMAIGPDYNEYFTGVSDDLKMVN